MKTPPQIAQIIEKIIKEQNTTVAKVLKECNLNKDTIGTMKRGNEPSMKVISTLAQYLKVSTEYLVGLTDNPTPANKEDKEEDPGLVIIQRLRKSLPPADNERMVNVIKAMFDKSFPKDKNKEKDDNAQK